jgi:7,8-dihydroneopterin aldolase/epimerase/oxygenase
MTTKVIIRDMRADMLIGVKDHEKNSKQPVLINITASIRDNPDWGADDIENTVSYSPIVSGIRQIVARGHINLIETFAEHIAALCLQDSRVEEVIVRVEKTKVYDDASAVGVEIIRKRS